jgi:DNA repair protein RadD
MTRLRALLKENVTIELHPFQRDAVDRIEREISEERRRLLYVAPTGAGKTVVGAEIINRAVERHHRVLVIAHRREIITQTRDKLVANGVNPGIVLAGFEHELRP